MSDDTPAASTGVRPVRAQPEAGGEAADGLGAAAEPSDCSLIADWGLACARARRAGPAPKLPLAVVGVSVPQAGVEPAFEAPPI